MKKMKNKVVFLIFMVFLNVELFGGNNSQATLGDIKEAVYKLIIESKLSNSTKSNTYKKIDGRIEKLETTNNSIFIKSEEDNLDKYIAKFVSLNKAILPNLK